MSRFRRQLLFLCDAFLFAVAVAGYKFITVLLPYTATGAEYTAGTGQWTNQNFMGQRGAAVRLHGPCSDGVQDL